MECDKIYKLSFEEVSMEYDASLYMSSKYANLTLFKAVLISIAGNTKQTFYRN